MTGMLGASNGGSGLRAMADQASALLGFSLADANPVSVITEKVRQSVSQSVRVDVVRYRMGWVDHGLVGKWVGDAH
jgi:hypothetical protein